MTAQDFFCKARVGSPLSCQPAQRLDFGNPTKVPYR